MKYQAPIGAADPDDPYIDGNPATGTPGSPVPAKSIEHPMREIVAAIVASGLTPDEGDLAQLLAVIRLGGRPAKSYSANDYSELPGGLIVQFGVATWSGESALVNFPIAFPSSCKAVVPIAEFDNGSVAITDRQSCYFVASALNSGSNATGTNNYAFMAIGF